VPTRALMTVAALVFCITAAGTAPAGASTPHDDPFRLGWPAYAATVLADTTASTEIDCTPGSVACVDNVVVEMQRRVDQLGCAHEAVFAFVYLRTTQEYRRAVADPHFFADNAFVNHEDALFADTYFDAHDRYRAGALAQVPPAWRIAFHSSEQRQLSALGDMLLGMNAHINRDLPFVLHAIGLVDEEGRSRKADHDRVNDILALVNRYVLFEVSLRYDPTAIDGRTPATTMDARSLQSLVTRWREGAWRNAELLAAARTPAQRLQVARTIETQAGAMALSLLSTYANSPTTDVAARDAHCRSH
jgi:hypothetical protein